MHALLQLQALTTPFQEAYYLVITTDSTSRIELCFFLAPNPTCLGLKGFVVIVVVHIDGNWQDTETQTTNFDGK
ncbi:hypothetical protein ACJX0J_021631, partial [Zea mays]